MTDKYDIRLVLADGINIELFGADYHIEWRLDGTPSYFHVFNEHVAYVIPAFKVEAMLRSDDTGQVDAFIRADRYTLGREPTDSDWGWYSEDKF